MYNKYHKTQRSAIMSNEYIQEIIFSLNLYTVKYLQKVSKHTHTNFL